METYIFEVTDGTFYGKFLVGLIDDDVWNYRALLEDEELPANLMHREGWWAKDWFFLQDLSNPGNGSFFSSQKGGNPKLDVQEKRMEVCYLFTDFLGWIRNQGFDRMEELPKFIRLEHSTPDLTQWRLHSHGNNNRDVRLHRC